MDFDPHTLHHILDKIRQQMRCPQCGDRIPVDFASVRLTGDDFLLLQLKCGRCNAYVVLHAALQVQRQLATKEAPKGVVGLNISSSLCKTDDDIAELRNTLERAGGSFTQMFSGTTQKTGPVPGAAQGPVDIV